MLEADAQSLQLLTQPVTITAEAATLAAVSPTPVPQPASETAAAAVSTQGPRRRTRRMFSPRALRTR